MHQRGDAHALDCYRAVQEIREAAKGCHGVIEYMK